MSIGTSNHEQTNVNPESSRVETPTIPDDASIHKTCLESTENMEYDDDFYEEAAQVMGIHSSIGCVCCATVPIIPPWTDLKSEIFRLFRPRSILDDLHGIDNGTDADPASLLREVMNTVQNLDN